MAPWLVGNCRNEFKTDSYGYGRRLSVPSHTENPEGVSRKHSRSEESSKCSLELKRKKVFELRIEDTKRSVPVPRYENKRIERENGDFTKMSPVRS